MSIQREKTLLAKWATEIYYSNNFEDPCICVHFGNGSNIDAISIRDLLHAIQSASEETGCKHIIFKGLEQNFRREYTQKIQKSLPNFTYQIQKNE